MCHKLNLKESLIGRNSDFSFSKTDLLTKIITNKKNDYNKTREETRQFLCKRLLNVGDRQY